MAGEQLPARRGGKKPPMIGLVIPNFGSGNHRTLSCESAWLNVEPLISSINGRTSSGGGIIISLNISRGLTNFVNLKRRMDGGLSIAMPPEPWADGNKP
jgi:hypothetical protein